jgi:phosphatidate phosphatase APP1
MGDVMLSKFVLLAFFILSSQLVLAKELVVISDLDETLRMANVEKKFKAGVKIVTGVKVYKGLKSIFQEIKAKNPEVTFYYLSNSYRFLYNGDTWTTKNDLPKGIVYQRAIKDKSDTFKPIKLKEIVGKHPNASFLLFGDNIERDPIFYRNLIEETKLSDVQVFIRDARLIFNGEPNMIYYQTEAQITDDLNMSEATKAFVQNLSFHELVPRFLLKNLEYRIKKSCQGTRRFCHRLAERKVKEVAETIKPIPAMTLY